MIQEEKLLKDYPELLDVEDLVKILGISKNLCYRLIRGGIIKARKVGRSYKATKIHLIDYFLKDEGNDN